MALVDTEAVSSLAPSDFRRAASWLSDATHVLIGAGAGMSVEAGNDYFDKKAFAEHFPAMVKRGFQYPYQMVGKRDWEPALQWGYLAAHVLLVRWTLPPHKVYADLLGLVKDKKHFVLTSNVDGMFERNGFDPKRIYTIQGDFQFMQCLQPCTRQVWPAKSVLERVQPAIDKATQEVSDPALVPKCPNCGGRAMMNVRGGDWFIEDHYAEQQQRMQQFIAEGSKPGNKLVLLEIGVGFNTPTVIRHRFERLAYERIRNENRCRFIRLNLFDPEVPEVLADCAVGLRSRTGEAFTAIREHLAASG